MMSELSHDITPTLLDAKKEPSHTYKPNYSDNSSLVALLASLKFKNYGIVKSTDKFIMQDIPCGYTLLIA